MRALDQLLAYWLGELPADESEAVEAHVFGCDECTRRLDGVAEIARGVVKAVRGGRVRLNLTAALVERLERDGIKMRHYRLGAGESVQCTVGADDDLLVGWLRVDLAGAARVDLIWTGADGAQLSRAEDVPVDRAAGLAIGCARGVDARTWPDATFVVRLVAVDASGDHTLGEYTFNHTALRPGG